MNFKFNTLLLFSLTLSINCFINSEIIDPVVIERIKSTETRQECIVLCTQFNQQIRQLCKSDTCETYAVDTEIECNKACRLQKADQSQKDVRDKALIKVFKIPDCEQEKDQCLAECPKRKEAKCKDNCETEKSECKILVGHIKTLETMFKEQKQKEKEKEESKKKINQKEKEKESKEKINQKKEEKELKNEDDL